VGLIHKNTYTHEPQSVLHHPVAGHQRLPHTPTRYGKIGVVSVVSQYKCVYYCDTYLPHTPTAPEKVLHTSGQPELIQAVICHMSE
jgi:hypothetical protein